MTAPERIWLQWLPEADGTDDATWCRDQIGDTDLEFVRAYMPPALSAAAMKRAALDAVNNATHFYLADIPFIDHEKIYRTIEAIPDPSPADLLRDAARVLFDHQEMLLTSGKTYVDFTSVEKEFAIIPRSSLRAIIGEA